MDYIMCFIVGAFVGWVIPAPRWAQDAVAYLKARLDKGGE